MGSSVAGQALPLRAAPSHLPATFLGSAVPAARAGGRRTGRAAAAEV